MFYSSYTYILPNEQRDITSFNSYNSIFLKQPHKAPAYDSTITLSNSILYALEKNILNINEISDMMWTLLSSKCENTSSDFFGLFPYSTSLTEDYYVMPDYDFQILVLLPLLECYIDFNHLFPRPLMTQLSETLTLTTNIISYSSNLIDSHNKLLEIILLICVGEYFSIPQFIHSAVNKANSYYHFIKYNGDMPLEYNSPNLIILQLEAITHFSAYITNEDIKKVLNEIKDILFSVFYRHFNPHLLQWTGPFSIFPTKFITNDLLERIKKVTNQESLIKINVPKKFCHLSPVQENKFERLLVSRGILFPHYKHYLVATLYNTKTFSLCSFNHDDLWYKRMPCIGYFGDTQNHYCLYVQCLLNDFSFSSGAFHSIQHKEVLLGHINFSTNRGYKGIALDNSDTYKTSDLRIRFCIEGDTSKLKIVQRDDKIRITYGKLFILFNSLYANFENNKITYEFTTYENRLYFDIVLYHGNEIDLELKKINEAIIAFSLYISEKNITKCEAETYQDENFLFSKICIDDIEMKLKSHKKPDNYEVIFSQDAQYISDVNIGTYIDKEETFTKHHNFFFENNNTQSYYLKENNIYNKKILRKISNICKYSLNDVKSEINNIFNSLDDFSDSETRHYSVLVLHQLYALATQTDRRFIKLIEVNYNDVYQLVRTATNKKQIKKIIVNTANQLYSDYRKLQTQKLSNTTGIIEEIIKIIHSEFTNPDLSLQNIASAYGVSESYISRKFSEYMGISYVKYITQLRINKAIDLLNSNPNITDLHSQCGYYNIQTFVAAFKKVTGLTVKNFLNRQQTNN